MENKGKLFFKSVISYEEKPILIFSIVKENVTSSLDLIHKDMCVTHVHPETEMHPQFVLCRTK